MILRFCTRGANVTWSVMEEAKKMCELLGSCRVDALASGAEILTRNGRKTMLSRNRVLGSNWTENRYKESRDILDGISGIPELT